MHLNSPINPYFNVKSKQARLQRKVTSDMDDSFPQLLSITEIIRIILLRK